MTDRVKGYSLWLMPEGEAKETLESLIARLSEKFDTPPFLPHLTLLGQVVEDEDAVIKKTARLAASLAPLTIHFEGAGYKDEYFRCLFLIAGKDPALMSANLAAREMFGRIDDPTFMPHLSLVYGNLSARDKEGVISEMAGLFDYSFQVSKISLFSTAGFPHEWYPVEDFSLRQRSATRIITV